MRICAHHFCEAPHTGRAHAEDSSKDVDDDQNDAYDNDFIDDEQIGDDLPFLRTTLKNSSVDQLCHDVDAEPCCPNDACALAAIDTAVDDPIVYKIVYMLSAGTDDDTVFGFGHTYVALSRCRSRAGTNIAIHAIKPQHFSLSERTQQKENRDDRDDQRRV